MFVSEFPFASSFSGVNVTVFVFLPVCGVLFPFNFARFVLICAGRSAARFPPRAAIFLCHVTGSGNALIKQASDTPKGYETINSQFNKDTVEEMNEDDDEDEEETREREDDDGDDEGFSVLSELPVEKSERRPTCRRCCRPLKVCLCPYLPPCPLDVSTCLYIVQHPAEVQLRSAPSSQYVIRTQPTNMCVSTLECAAAALSIMEKNHSIQEVLLKPLQALCSFQLQHGAQIHHSKEHLIKNGQYNKIMPKNKRKIRRMQKLLANQNI
uniref:tRNA-uridine aminocarboxypropyltransferase n=1 Tax=Sinocyclocheilus anshuiensis TaxID=1608454 RepID=A0A671PN84_9TELE